MTTFRASIFAAMALSAWVGTAALAAPAPPAPVTAGDTVERCKKSPELCVALIKKESSRVVAAKEACIPKAVSSDDVAARVMRVVEDVLEEDFGFREVNYTMLAGQIIAFIWPCGVVS